MVGAGSTVYLGFPIWWMAPVWLVNDSVKSNDFAGKTIIPFCTSASSDIGNSASTLQKMAGSGTWLTGHRFSESVSDVYGQINVYGVTTKSERHKRSYWTRTADGNGIGGRKAPVPYGSDRFPSAVLGRKGMTTPVRIQQSIRQLETKGLTHTQIARELGVSRTTVVKYATRDYSPVPPTGGTASRSRSRASTRARPTNGSRPTGAL